MARTIGIAGAKGGVGKTTVAINTAHALTEFGREVICIDADFRRPQLGLLLGYEKAPRCLRTAIKGEHDIKSCTYLHPCGIRIIPASYNQEHIDIDQLFQTIHALHNTCEVMFIDTSPEISERVSSIFSGCDDIIIVTTADEVSLHHAEETLALAQKTSTPVLGIIVNKTDNKDCSFIQGRLKKPVIAVIPYSHEIILAQEHKHPVTYTDVTCDASIAFKTLAANLIGEKYVPAITRKEKPWQDMLKMIGWKD